MIIRQSLFFFLILIFQSTRDRYIATEGEIDFNQGRLVWEMENV